MTPPHTIARIWSGRVPPEASERFVVHLAATGIAHAETVAGFRGALVLRRVEGDRVRFILVTFWRDQEAVRRFAGPDPDVAVRYSGDEQLALDPDEGALHYEVVLDHGGARCGP
jgi:heme-degrading monooxygenase HmoA